MAANDHGTPLQSKTGNINEDRHASKFGKQVASNQVTKPLIHPSNVYGYGKLVSSPPDPPVVRADVTNQPAPNDGSSEPSTPSSEDAEEVTARPRMSRQNTQRRSRSRDSRSKSPAVQPRPVRHRSPIPTRDGSSPPRGRPTARKAPAVLISSSASPSSEDVEAVTARPRKSHQNTQCRNRPRNSRSKSPAAQRAHPVRHRSPVGSPPPHERPTAREAPNFLISSSASPSSEDAKEVSARTRKPQHRSRSRGPKSKPPPRAGSRLARRQSPAPREISPSSPPQIRQSRSTRGQEGRVELSGGFVEGSDSGSFVVERPRGRGDVGERTSKGRANVELGRSTRLHRSSFREEEEEEEDEEDRFFAKFDRNKRNKSKDARHADKSSEDQRPLGNSHSNPRRCPVPNADGPVSLRTSCPLPMPMNESYGEKLRLAGISWAKISKAALGGLRSGRDRYEIKSKVTN